MTGQPRTSSDTDQSVLTRFPLPSPVSRLYKLRGAQRVNGGFMTHLTPGDAIQVNVPVNITISTVSCRLDNVSVRSTNLYVVRYHKSFSFLFSFLRSIWWLRSLTFSRVETDHNWYVTHVGDAELMWKWSSASVLSAHLITKSSLVFSIKTKVYQKIIKCPSWLSFRPACTVGSNFLHSSTEKYEVENWDQQQLIAIIKSQHWEVSVFCTTIGL